MATRFQVAIFIGIKDSPKCLCQGDKKLVFVSGVVPFETTICDCDGDYDPCPYYRHGKKP
jgi:hypothetical protein